MRSCLKFLLLALAGLGMAATSYAAQTAAIAPGTIVGIVTDTADRPISRATVTAVCLENGSIRATLSGADGVYSFADLPPGTWSVTVHVDGTPDAVARALPVTSGKATRQDIAMNGTPAPPVARQPVLAASPPAGTSAPRGTSPAAPASAVNVPEALQTPEPAPENDTQTPFAVGDLGWMNGYGRATTPIFDTKLFTPEVRFDVNYLQDLNHPKDHTIVGSTEEFRSGEFQIEQVSLGGNFHWHNVQARFLSMFGMFAVTTPRNDASAGVGQWDLQGAYKYFSEANAGYHWDVNHGLNVDAGIFVSYVGLFSYYNFDNWTYQPSFVSSNTPWFFNGLRVQWFPTQTLKIEPWLINGWQSYAKFNKQPGFGGQILWIPNDAFKLVLNSYTLGQDNLASGSGVPNNGGSPTAAIGLANPQAPFINYAHVTRVHEDDSVLWKYFDAKDSAGLSKLAFSLTWDFGCEYGGGVNCTHGPNKANFLGVMLYNRAWFDHDRYAITLGGGFMNNPGRYLALVPPIDGATAQSGTPYFTENPGQALLQWDTQLNFQYMPRDWITWWTEATFRHSNVPYWAGTGGVTPPLGNTGSPASMVCNNGSAIGTDGCANEGGVWYPDLRTREVIWGAGVMVKF
ncbi:MAG TPA: outer membrane beta-barrel protein [Steroidobacteraceae bacterium]|nr:outer membrane beta-barrel protein [Steroidobacteraceae bacterium]